MDYSERAFVEPSKLGSLAESGGKTYMRLDDTCDGVELPDDIAYPVRLGFWAQDRSKDPKNELSRDAFDRVNCHKAVLHALGLRRITMSEILDQDDPEYDEARRALLFPSDRLQTLHTRPEIEHYILSTLKGQLGVVQVENKGGESLHTFLVGVDQRNRLVCCEKVGFRLPLRILQFEEVYNFYKKEFGQAWPLEWLCGTVEELKDK
jgi:hypothetical protein